MISWRELHGSDPEGAKGFIAEDAGKGPAPALIWQLKPFEGKVSGFPPLKAGASHNPLSHCCSSSAVYVVLKHGRGVKTLIRFLATSCPELLLKRKD